MSSYSKNIFRILKGGSSSVKANDNSEKMYPYGGKEAYPTRKNSSDWPHQALFSISTRSRFKFLVEHLNLCAE